MKILSNNNLPAGAKSVCLAVLLLCAYLIFPKNASAQGCSSSTPAYTIDLTGHPDTTWISPSVSRNGQCCLATGSDRCIVFYITLDSLSSGIEVDAVGGLGATDYTISCDATTTRSLGTKACIANPTTSFYVTICKPGGNAQKYTVKSIPKPYLVINPENVSPNCPAKLEAKGLVATSVNWKSISGSQYDKNLSCSTGCATPTVTASANMPSYIDYQVCGTPVSACFGTSFCDTIRVYYYDTLKVNITPSPTAYICTGSTTVRVTATVSGGKPPYSYYWNKTGSTDTFADVNASRWILRVKDALGCQVAYDTVTGVAATNPTTKITGSSIICIYEEGTYFAPLTANRFYTWDVNGGIITSGSGTNAIGVIWSSTGSKTITLTETNTITKCSTTVTKSVTVHPLPVTAPIKH